MAKFKDEQGDVWKLRLTVGMMKKVLKDTDINLGGFNEQGVSYAHVVRTDAIKLAMVLFSMLEEELDKAKITEDEFCERLHGDSFGAARDAFWQAFLDFCPSDQRTNLQALEAKQAALQKELMDQMNGITADHLISLETHMKQQGSSESIQTLLRNAN